MYIQIETTNRIILLAGCMIVAIRLDRRDISRPSYTDPINFSKFSSSSL